MHLGLPPGPITNPGDDAIEAALNPTKGDWLFFVTTDPKSEHHQVRHDGGRSSSSSKAESERQPWRLSRMRAQRLPCGLADRPLALAAPAPGRLRRAGADRLELRGDRVRRGGAAGCCVSCARAAATAEWAGLSLTMPLKRAVLPLLDTVSDAAPSRSAGPTPWSSRDGAAHGDNTDVHGIVQALAEAGVAAPRSATVLGGGATAASALAALRELGLDEATLVVRDPARAGETAEVAERLGWR